MLRIQLLILPSEEEANGNKGKKNKILKRLKEKKSLLKVDCCSYHKIQTTETFAKEGQKKQPV